MPDVDKHKQESHLRPVKNIVFNHALKLFSLIFSTRGIAIARKVYNIETPVVDFEMVY